MVLRGKTLKEIHKEIYKITIEMPKMTYMMVKIANKCKKVIKNPPKNIDIPVIALALTLKDQNANAILQVFKQNDYNNKVKKVINHDLTEKTEKEKENIIKNYIKTARNDEKWIYLASSHTDCAKDHKPYQGKLYYDEKAPEDIQKLAKARKMRTIQWVMGEPAWFITRPNCRHFFKALPTDVVKKYNREELTRRYKTHRKVGDRALATSRSIAIEEYEDRLKMLQAMYAKHPTEYLRRDIEKTKLLLKKWKNSI